ncbi:Ribosomal large subunit pseudouridine synthase C [Buchnera aphidicola (Tetraneura ulmi)]|uniref:RluA family pseudouridine synthase n=1 Tax=Buchnera aphidicola TaxID=9 RepID=UPI0034640750
MIKTTKKPHFLNVTEQMIPQRIDNFLISYMKLLSKNKIYKILRKGNVRVNKKRVLPKYKLKIGDKIRIPPIKKQYVNTIKKKNIQKNTDKKLLKKILFEDDDLIIINKPSGIAVHGGSGISTGIIEKFRLLRPLCKNLELVHRLDKETSGLLIMSKKRFALNFLHEQIRNKKIKKKYIALVHGNWPNSTNIINFPLLKKKLNINKNKKKVCVHKLGKPSETHFFVKKRFKNNTTLVYIYPITGRTHQIRVHSAHLNSPIVFDNRYGSKTLDRKIKKTNGPFHLLLHAKEIQFIHPKNKKKIILSAPLDKKFKNYLEYLYKI